MPLSQLKAASNIMNCRTAAMGGRVHACPSGEEGHDHCILYNSSFGVQTNLSDGNIIVLQRHRKYVKLKTANEKLFHTFVNLRHDSSHRTA